MRFSGRYGFSERFEGELTLNLKHVSYQSQPYLPALPEPGEDGQVDPVATRTNITDFSGTALGPGDIFLTGRYNLLRSLLMITTEGSLKVPAGYETPNALNVTLGDGQIDYTQSLLLGTVLPETGTFARLDAGFRLRSGMPGPPGGRRAEDRPVVRRALHRVRRRRWGLHRDRWCAGARSAALLSKTPPCRSRRWAQRTCGFGRSS